MSRFDQGRWNRVVVWTGAALAWGSAFVAARLEPSRDVPSTPAPKVAPAGVEAGAAFPVPPEDGIVVIRRPGASAPSQPAPAVSPTPGPAPPPVSSGS
jgi:hypothetical protein